MLRQANGKGETTSGTPPRLTGIIARFVFFMNMQHIDRIKDLFAINFLESEPFSTILNPFRQVDIVLTMLRVEC
jgi:hypothetical protein